MRLVCLLLVASLAPAAGWDAVKGISPGTKIEVTTRDGADKRGVFVSATQETLVMKDKSGERSFERDRIRYVRVANPGRRKRNGWLAVAGGAVAGMVVGVAVCPYCENEGGSNPYVAPAIAVGAGLGALAFLSVPYRTVYRRE